MSLKEIQSNLAKVAQHIASLPGSLEGASRVLNVSDELAYIPKVSAEEDDEERLGMEYLQDHLEPFKKGSALWLPPHNLCLNRALMGWNLWVFTILPHFPKKKAYRSDLNGIVIRPSWTSLPNKDFSAVDLKLAERLVSVMQKATTVQETIRKEMDWIEREFKIEIPSAIRSRMEKECLTMARRRWGVDLLRLKDRLIPLDGSKPRDLSSWG